MSVLIKRMKMPESCFTCPISHHAYSLSYQLQCGITGKITAYPSCEEKRMDKTLKTAVIWASVALVAAVCVFVTKDGRWGFLMLIPLFATC